MNMPDIAGRARALQRAGYFTSYNGITHMDLTTPAYARLEAHLIKHDNVLSDGHRAALMGLVGMMTKMAQGQLKGRWAFPLPTGMGKTSAVISWISALSDLGADHVSVAVACSKVEALCKMKMDLISLGVPEQKIGLRHSHHNALLPSTEDDDRQLMLVTHARVRDGEKLKHFSHFQGRPRDLLIYDESLITSDSVGIAVNKLDAVIGYIERGHRDSEAHQHAAGYLDHCLKVIRSKLTELTNDDNGQNEAIIDLPNLDPHQRELFKQTIAKSDVVAPAANLLDIGQEPVRLIKTGNGGVVSYTVAVAPELQNILVLDASHPIRRLVHADKTIHNAEEEDENIKRGST